MKMLSRRTFVAAGSAAVSLAALGFPSMSFAKAATNRRFVFIIQRGAADGLHIVAPTGDPAYAGLRGDFAQDLAQGAKLGSFFTLHPALAETAKLYAAKQALFVHAVASPYRDRSHFDGQNVLETGGSGPYQVKDGWLNRLATLLPRTGKEAIAFSPAVPMALRGAAEVTTYAPSALPQANDELMMRVEQLYANDAQLHAIWSSALSARGMAGGMGGGPNRDPATLGRMAA